MIIFRQPLFGSNRSRTGNVRFSSILLCLSLSVSYAKVSVAQVTVTQTNKLIANDGGAPNNPDFGEGFSASLALWEDIAVVSAPSAVINNKVIGAACVFNARTGQSGPRLLATDGVADNGFGTQDNFGQSVAVHSNRALTGASYANQERGAAYIFDTTSGQQIQKLVASDGQSMDNFGQSTALSDSFAVVGAYADDFPSSTNCGSAYLFDAQTGTQLRKLIATDGDALDLFGSSVALSGNTVLIGAQGADVNGNTTQGAVYTFDALTGLQTRKLVASDGATNADFGASIAMSGNLALVGAYLARVGDNQGQDCAYLSSGHLHTRYGHPQNNCRRSTNPREGGTRQCYSAVPKEEVSNID